MTGQISTSCLTRWLIGLIEPIFFAWPRLILLLISQCGERLSRSCGLADKSSMQQSMPRLSGQTLIPNFS